jgi:predicted dehydrogenase
MPKFALVVALSRSVSHRRCHTSLWPAGRTERIRMGKRGENFSRRMDQTQGRSTPRKARVACRTVILTTLIAALSPCWLVLGSSTAPLTQLCQSLRQRRARVLLVGSGRMGQIRARLLHCHSRVDLCGIVDSDLEGAQHLAALYGDVPVFESIEQAVHELGNEKESGDDANRVLHGCVISTPTGTHGDLIREAARHRLSVFVEKPVAERAPEIDELFDCCEKAGGHLCCGFQRRFDPSYVEACRAIQRHGAGEPESGGGGGIGRPLYAHVFFADHPVPPRDFLLSSGGNIFVDLLAHDVDYVLNALQDQVATVYATATSSDPDLGAVGVQDCATVMLTTRKGTFAKVHSNWARGENLLCCSASFIDFAVHVHPLHRRCGIRVLEPRGDVRVRPAVRGVRDVGARPHRQRRRALGRPFGPTRGASFALGALVSAAVRPGVREGNGRLCGLAAVASSSSIAQPRVP